MSDLPINTTADLDAPPAFRWQAWRGDYDLDMTVGTGPTPDEAMQDLYDQED